MVHALKVLEFSRIQEMLADHCENELARSAALSCLPIFDEAEVQHEQSLTREAFDLAGHELPSLRGVYQVDGALKLAAKGRAMDPGELAKVGQSLYVFERVRSSLLERESSAPGLIEISDAMPELPDLRNRIQISVDMDGFVLDSASPALAEARSKKLRAEKLVLSRIQAYTSGRFRDLLSDTVTTQRNGRHVVPLKAENRGKIRGIVHDSSASGQTIFLEPEDVVAAGNQLREAEAAEKAEVERVIAELSAWCGDHAQEIIAGLEAAGRIDLIFARVRLGRETGCCLPEPADFATIEIRDGRHPLLDPKIAVPLSLNLGGEVQGLLITGPNTGGKTVSMKTVGLYLAMHQCGMMLPAKVVKIGFFPQIWADIGDEQSLQQSLSTFSGHIKNISAALNGIERGGLVLLDEAGAGTDPTEGAALARAILTELQSCGAVVMASSHYGELKVFASNQPGFVNASVEFDVKSLQPTYKFQMGTPGSSHALKIAKRYGIPDHVIGAAEEGFSQSEQDIARMIEKLEVAQKQATRAQSRADQLSSELEELRADMEEKLEKAESERLKIRKRASEELDELLRQIRIETAETFEELRKNPTQQGRDKARQRLKDLQSVGESFSKDMRPKEKPKSESKEIPLIKGTKVRVLNLKTDGVLLEDPRGKKVMVLIGKMRTEQPLKNLLAIEAPAKPEPKKATRQSAGLVRDKAQKMSREVHLRHFGAEDAADELERFLDEAILGGATSVRIVHGKGEGVLRNVTHDLLRRHKSIKSFQLADAEQGGHGVTIALIK
ncbi:MAG: endonuclease MutS2 [Armatimonadetes bacterium]|nr:endonuclease MutS2 [Armatimonadota bacterium]